MGVRWTRRGFLKATALAAGAVAGAGLSRGPILLAADSPSSKLNVVQIGCGSRGTGAHMPKVVTERLVAVVDVDANQSAKCLKFVKDNAAKFKLENFDPSKVKIFTDYRKMFDAMGKDVDAVSIATPDHHHVGQSMAAMRRGKHVYCEKPFAHNVKEARLLGDTARQCKVATQMGNQGMGVGGDQILFEYLQAGAIGAIKEVHTWHGFGDRFGGSFPRPETLPVPAGMDWEGWLGPAAFRDYHNRLHPTYWHGYHDFGTGSLGGWGPHMWDAIHFALKLTYPTSAEIVEMNDPSDERFPMLSTICYDFPANGARQALKVFWYEGGRVKGSDVGPESDNAITTGSNRPKLAAEIEKKYDRKLGNAGSLFVGEKGVMHAGSHGKPPRIVPEEQHKAFPMPAATLPRVKGGIWGDFVDAAKGNGAKCISAFDTFAGPVMEYMYVGHLAMRAGKGKKVLWDGANMKCTNMPELNKYVTREYRKGWDPEQA